VCEDFLLGPGRRNLDILPGNLLGFPKILPFLNILIGKVLIGFPGNVRQNLGYLGFCLGKLRSLGFSIYLENALIPDILQLRRHKILELKQGK
jgi:hypothetical protein